MALQEKNKKEVQCQDDDTKLKEYDSSLLPKGRRQKTKSIPMVMVTRVRTLDGRLDLLCSLSYYLSQLQSLNNQNAFIRRRLSKKMPKPTCIILDGFSESRGCFGQVGVGFFMVLLPCIEEVSFASSASRK